MRPTGAKVRTILFFMLVLVVAGVHALLLLQLLDECQLHSTSLTSNRFLASLAKRMIVSWRYKLSGCARRNSIFVPGGTVNEPTETPVRAPRVVLGLLVFSGSNPPAVLMGTVRPLTETPVRFRVSGPG